MSLVLQYIYTKYDRAEDILRENPDHIQITSDMIVPKERILEYWGNFGFVVFTDETAEYIDQFCEAGIKQLIRSREHGDGDRRKGGGGGRGRGRGKRDKRGKEK